MLGYDCALLLFNYKATLDLAQVIASKCCVRSWLLTSLYNTLHNMATLDLAQVIASKCCARSWLLTSLYNTLH